MHTVLVFVCVIVSISCALQGLTDHFDDIVVAVGSGGTAEGLAIANHLTNSGLK